MTVVGEAPVSDCLSSHKDGWHRCVTGAVNLGKTD